VKNALLPQHGLQRFCWVFLRRHRKTIDDICYDYWSLCESVRTAAGPRQRVVATLGKLSDDEARPEAGWDEMRHLLEGRPAAKQMRLEEKLPAGASPPHTRRWEVADVAALRVERVRDFGEAWLGLALWHRLGLHKLLAEIIEPGKEDVPWADVAAVLTTARFCAQRSELVIAEHWYERTALEDITGIPLSKINDDRLYRGLDVLAEHKDKLCAHLMDRYRDWFGIQFEFLIYDVTSTFFEGQAMSNTKAARGYSRDQRSDCKQVCIGLVCSPEGLPLCFEVFAGNRADVTTVEDIVKRMEDKYGQANRVWVMDRGMVSEKNIAFLRERKARYLVGTPKSQLREFETQLLDHDGWSDVQDGLEARLIAHPDGKGEEQYVLCRSSARAEKERAMLARQSDRLTEELLKIDTALRRHPETDLEKLGRRIGRHQGKNPAAAKHIDIQVQRDAKSGAAIGLQITTPMSKGQRSDQHHGAYLLRTNCTETDPAKLWRWYIQLTQAEAAFRTAKSDLKLRPIYHQKTARVEAHILVCFLALAQWRVLEQWMSGKGLGTCARKLVAEISTIKSMDVIIPVKRGETSAELTVRTVARPERRVAELLTRLDLELPARNRILGEVPAGVAASAAACKM
jgi:transposase